MIDEKPGMLVSSREENLHCREGSRSSRMCLRAPSPFRAAEEEMNMPLEVPIGIVHLSLIHAGWGASFPKTSYIS
jgi:hypothetical protein